MFSRALIIGLFILPSRSAHAGKRIVCEIEPLYSRADDVAIVRITSVAALGSRNSDGPIPLRIQYKSLVTFKGRLQSGDSGSFEYSEFVPRDAWGGLGKISYSIQKNSTLLLFLKGREMSAECNDAIIAFDSRSIRRLKVAYKGPPTIDGLIESLFQRIESGEPGFYSAMGMLLRHIPSLADDTGQAKRLIADAQRFLDRHKHDSTPRVSTTHLNDLRGAEFVLSRREADLAALQKLLNDGSKALADREFFLARSAFKYALKLDPQNARALKGLHDVVASEQREAMPMCPIAWSSTGQGDVFARGDACNPEAHRLECGEVNFPQELATQNIAKASARVQFEVAPTGEVVPGTIDIAGSSGHDWFDAWAVQFIKTQCDFRQKFPPAGNVFGEAEFRFDPEKFSHLPTKRATKVR